MTPALVSGDPALVSQCLELCQVLAKKGQPFTISINLGSTFTFSLDTRGDPVVAKKKKKPSPSRLRRNQKRKEEFLKRKSEISTETFKCDQCGNIFNTNNGLKIHVGKTHKKVEVIRSVLSEAPSPKLPSQKEVPRKEQLTSSPSNPPLASWGPRPRPRPPGGLGSWDPSKVPKIPESGSKFVVNHDGSITVLK